MKHGKRASAKPPDCFMLYGLCVHLPYKASRRFKKVFNSMALDAMRGVLTKARCMGAKR